VATASESSPVPARGYAIGIDDALAVANQIKGGRASATIHIGPRALLGVVVSDGSRGGFFGGSGVAVAHIEQVQLVDHKPGDSVTVAWIDPSGTRHSATVYLTSGPPA
jgi:hypothetical protein